MIKPVHSAALLLAMSAVWLPAQAQNVYRCGESYSNVPCPGAKVVPTEDARSPAQRAQTEAATRRDARSAQVMETERLKEEGKPAQAIIPAAKAEPAAPATDRTLSKAKVKKPDMFIAITPKKPGEVKKKKKKASAKVAA